MNDLRRLAEAAIQAEKDGGHISEYDEAADPQTILKLLEVVDKARTVTTAKALASTPKYGREAEAEAMEALRTALQALDSSAIRDMREGGS